MRRAYVAVTARMPVSEASYLMPLAQSAFETGNWRSMFGWNTGNITTHGDPDDWFYQYAGSLKFKSYPSLDDGALAQVKTLNHMHALEAADAGDVAGFVDELRRGHYIGNDQKAYQDLQNALPSLMAKYRGVVPAPASASSPPSLAKPLLIGAAIIAASLAGAVYLRRHPLVVRRRAAV